MNEIMKRTYEYRTFNIKYSSKTSEWIITRSNGAALGTSYSTPKTAKEYIDAILKP